MKINSAILYSFALPDISDCLRMKIQISNLLNYQNYVLFTLFNLMPKLEHLS